MKKTLFAIFAIAALVSSNSVRANKVTTVINVPGTAKTATTTGSSVKVDCDPVGLCCYTSTTTTESGTLKLNTGDRVEISGTTDQNQNFDIVGGYIDSSEQQEADGSIMYIYDLSATWNQ